MSIGDWSAKPESTTWEIVLDERGGITYTMNLSSADGYDQGFVHEVATKVHDDPVFRDLLLRMLRIQRPRSCLDDDEYGEQAGYARTALKDIDASGWKP